MTGAGDLDQRYRFERRSIVDDGYGNEVAGDFIAQFTVWTGRRFLRGGEGVLAARLAARSPMILTVRSSTAAKQITADWRAVDVRTGEIVNVRETPQPSKDRAFLEMLCEAGVAT